MINGELHLEWVGGTPLPPRAKLPPVSPLKGVKGLPLKGIGVATPGPLDTEKRIRELCANLTSAQRTVYQKEWANLKPASKAVNDKIALKSTSPSAVKTIPISLAPHIHLNAPPHVRSVHDSAREVVDKARYEALRRVLGDKIPTPMPADKIPKK